MKILNFEATGQKFEVLTPFKYDVKTFSGFLSKLPVTSLLAN